MRKIMPYSKKGAGLVSNLISGTGGLIILVTIILVIVSTILGANLLGAGEANDTVQDMQNNFTSGIREVSTKIPTIMLVAAVVLLFGVLVILVRQSGQMGIGGGTSSL